MGGPQVVIDGIPLLSVTPWGDLDWSTVWPGGSESISFGVARHNDLLRPDALVELVWAGERLWSGHLIDPTRGETLVAEGLYRRAEDFASLDGSGNANITDPATGVAYAISRGLTWNASPGDGPDWVNTAAAPLNHSGAISLARVLDHTAGSHGREWGVLPDRTPVMRGWSTATLHAAPGIDGLGITRDGYASRLIGRYLRSSDSTFQTVTAEDTSAAERWGIVEHTINEPLAEGTPMTTVQAQALLDGLMARGRYEIGWKTPIEVEYGDILDAHGAPVALEKITAGESLIVHGLVDDVADLGGQTWVNFPVARVEHPSRDVAVLSPRSLRSPMNDVRTGGAP